MRLSVIADFQISPGHHDLTALDPRNLAAQVCLDQFVYHPLCYFPVFYACKELIGKLRDSTRECLCE